MLSKPVKSKDTFNVCTLYVSFFHTSTEYWCLSRKISQLSLKNMFIMLTIFYSEFVALESLHYSRFEAKVPGIIIFFFNILGKHLVQMFDVST